MPRFGLWLFVVILLIPNSPAVAAVAEDSDPSAPAVVPSGAQSSGTTPSSPLTIHVGDADLLIGGFMDATAIMRDTNHGAGIGTSFGTIPFGNTVPGNMSETRFSTQNSRLTLQATSKVGQASVKGYLEADFLGNAPNGLNVTSNSNTLRMRLYWMQFTSGKFEFLGGQSWSFLTPARNGLSPMPGDLFFSQNVDTNYQMGLTWGRTTQFRFVAHASDLVTAGVSVENPEQYVGTAVVLPAAFAASEVDTGATTTQVPNPYPDVIGKVAFDPRIGGRHQHLDAGVLVRGFKTYNPATGTSFNDTGSGGAVNIVLEPVKNVRIAATSFFSNGGGRYIANTNIPDFIVHADQSLSLVKSRSFIVGPEITSGKTLLYGYYSTAQANQNVTLDTNDRTIGFGVADSTAANHKLSEATVGIIQTFFRDPKIGGLQLMVQYSNGKRTPFSVPAGTPRDAKVNMVYLNVRYILP